MTKNCFLYSFLCLILVQCHVTESNYGKAQSLDFNFDWQFKLVKTTDSGASKAWKKINLPHDWSVEHSFDPDLEGCTGYLPGGIGIYKKEFLLKRNQNQIAYIVFDGVYNNASINLNGVDLGFYPYGYSPFYYDITEALNGQDSTNILEVHVDRSRYADSRWYTGSGIYRNVELVIKDKLHIPIWGTFITTPKISSQEAQVSIEINLKNSYDNPKEFQVHTYITDSHGNHVSSVNKNISISGNQKIKISQNLIVDNPELWGVDTPTMYNAVTQIIKDKKVIDTKETSFGIRSIRFDTENGFFLNGKNLKIKGVCLHHDAGLVGTAVPKGVWSRRLQKLKDAGCNAIRISHNPGSQEFLDLCDELGFLVQDEFFDEWDNPKDKRLNMNEKSVDYITRGYAEHFQDWAERDLKNTMRAHRNHPSIMQWSIGNEIEWTYPRNASATGFFDNMEWNGNYFWSEPPFSTEKIKKQLETLPKGNYDIGETAQKLAAWTREMDTTRYVTANCILPSASHLSGYADALDIVGYSYRRILYDYGHKNYPDKLIMGTENLPQWHEWKAVLERPFIPGLFIWTGIDYMGESNNKWPTKATNSGLLDVAGFEKPSYHMFKTLWNDDPHVYITTQTLDKSIYKLNKKGELIEKKENAWKEALWFWHDVNEHWNYTSDELIAVEVYANCEEVELFLDETSFGKKSLSDFEDSIMKWVLPFKPGKLKAVGYQNQETKKSYELITPDKPYRLQLSTDKQQLKADGYDVAHIIAQITDKNGKTVTTENAEIEFLINGDVKLLGVDNGSESNIQDYKSNRIVTHKGRCLLIVQSNRTPSEISIKATTTNLKSDEISLTSF